MTYGYGRINTAGKAAVKLRVAPDTPWRMPHSQTTSDGALNSFVSPDPAGRLSRTSRIYSRTVASNRRASAAVCVVVVVVI